MKPPKIIILLFIMTSITELFFLIIHKTDYRFITKSLLMPLLMGFLFLETLNSRTKLSVMVMIGLFFSFLGDVFLLKDSEEIFFLLGLGSFLVCHIFYIVGFSGGKNFFRNVSLIQIFPFLIYGTALYLFLFPHLGKFSITVLVYAIIITLMGIAALSRKNKTNKTSFILIISGAVLFIISDSIIALDKFYMSFSLASFFIMLSYISAQILIVLGTIKHSEE